MSAAELSEASGIPLRTIHRHLHDADSIKLDVLQAYAGHLKVDLAALLSTIDVGLQNWLGLPKIDLALHDYFRGEFSHLHRAAREAVLTADYKCHSPHYYSAGFKNNSLHAKNRGARDAVHDTPLATCIIGHNRQHQEDLNFSSTEELEFNYAWKGATPLDYRQLIVDSAFISGADHVCVHTTMKVVLYKYELEEGEAVLDRHDMREELTTSLCCVLTFNDSIAALMHLDGPPALIKEKTWQSLSSTEVHSLFDKTFGLEATLLLDS